MPDNFGQDRLYSCLYCVIGQHIFALLAKFRLGFFDLINSLHFDFGYGQFLG